MEIRDRGIGQGQARPGRTIRILMEALEDRRLLATGSPFTIVLLPDTQKYVAYYPQTFPAQTQWIANNIASQNIKFVSHVGDVVEHGGTDGDSSITEWNRADAAMDMIHGRVAYSVSIGNHDYDTDDNHGGVSRFLQYFGPSRYSGQNWYRGHSADQRNYFQTFSVGPWQFLHLNLEWEAPDSALSWARDVLASYRNYPTILTTHSYINASGTRTTGASYSAGNSGQAMWDELIKSNNQIFMTFNGHFTGEAHTTSYNSAGQPVFQLLADYQGYANGGNGFMQLIKFVPAENRIDVKTYSPTLNQFQTDANSQFSFSVNFDTRFNFAPAPAPTPGVRTITLQQGVNSYLSGADTMLRQNASQASTSFGTTTMLQVDDDTPPGSGMESQGLLRFDKLFSNQGGAIPLNSAIHSAKLTLQVTDAGSGLKLHRMLRSWLPTDTWNSRTSGIQADNGEAMYTPDASIGAANASANVPAGTITIDVTTSLQRWSGGWTNYGWAILPFAGGTDGVTWASNEYPTLTSRPRLTVQYTPATSAQTASGERMRTEPTETESITNAPEEEVMMARNDQGKVFRASGAAALVEDDDDVLV